MEHFYIVDIRTLPDPAQDSSAMNGLPVQRREKCLWYIQPEDRKRALGAGRIIQRILSDTGCSGPLSFGQNGKPETDGCFFNISHSGHYVIGVASDVPIGCDIEKMETPLLKTAEHYFYQSEREYIASHKDKSFAFWQLWTLKESYMKMTGEGMSLPLDSFEVIAKAPIELYRTNIRQQCSLRHLLLDGHSIAFCAKGNCTLDSSDIFWHYL